MDNDVISKKPQWMTLSCGVNDVWHFKLRLGKQTFQGVSLEDYKKNIAAIIDKAQAANIKVMILTATMIGEDPERELNKNLVLERESEPQMEVSREVPPASPLAATRENSPDPRNRPTPNTP